MRRPRISPGDLVSGGGTAVNVSRHADICRMRINRINARRTPLLGIKSRGAFPFQPQHPIDCAQYILFATQRGLKPSRTEKNARFVSNN